MTTAGSGGCIPGILAYVSSNSSMIIDGRHNLLIYKPSHHQPPPQSSNNIVSQTKRAVTTAIVVAFGGIGGVFASLVYRQVDFPTYLPGIYATIACQILMLLLLAITTIYYRAQNKGLRRGTIIRPLEGQAGFVYTL